MGVRSRLPLACCAPGAFAAFHHILTLHRVAPLLRPSTALIRGPPPLVAGLCRPPAALGEDLGTRRTRSDDHEDKEIADMRYDGDE